MGTDFRIAHSLSPKDVESLLEIGSALIAERDLNALLSLILRKSRKILGADAGSLYLTDGKGATPSTQLILSLSQNDSNEVKINDIVLPIDDKSLAGYVGQTGETLQLDDVYEVPPGRPFTFHGRVDKKTGYRSKSLLSVPMKDHKGVLIGVIQLWNKKRNPKQRLSLENIHQEVIPFGEDDAFLLHSLASQAAIAVENAKLYQDITSLFEGFIRASVTAIESRDPTTSGHSERVAKLTVALAKAVDATEVGPFRGMTFSREEFVEIEYASLLHDFGKIGVKESILVKAKKLYPLELDTIRDRKDLIHRELEVVSLEEKVRHLAAGGKVGDNAWKEIEFELKRKLREIDRTFAVIETSNEPTHLLQSVTDELREFRKIVGRRPDGRPFHLIDQDQLERLSIPRGSLSEKERRQIEAHVTHTYEFLRRIPWTMELRKIPDIAHAHHEKLNGQGYPRSIGQPEIPIASQMMAVTDIYDALVARDRPYKRALTVQNALDILYAEAREGMLNPDVVDIFVQKKIHAITNP